MDSELRLGFDVVCDYTLGESSSDSWIRTVKRKFNEEEEEGNNMLLENECAALLEAVTNQNKTVKDLHLELEEERNAAASAANETMSMILRLQREKAEIQMEARQFKTFAEEKMTHDQEKIIDFENLLYEKEQAIEALSYEVEAYKVRLLSYGLTESELQDCGFGRDSSTVRSIDVYPCEYTSLKCSVEENQIEEKVVVGQSPCWPYYDPNSPLGTCFAESPMSSDKVYTIDSIHVGLSEVKIEDETSKMSKGKLNGEETDIEKLYTRLQALEADKESLRQSIVSMRTDKSQLMLLKEIAQHLSKETDTTKRNQVSKIPFSVVTVFKWIVSFVSWKRKAKQNKYVYELSANNMGMLMMLGEGSGTRRWRCSTSSHV